MTQTTKPSDFFISSVLYGFGIQTRKGFKQGVIKGRALNVSTIKQALKGSYKKGNKSRQKNIDGFELNETLSDNEAQVYWNPVSQKAMVVHRGTATLEDVFQDVAFGLTGYKGRRFKKADRVQKEAERLYGADNISTLGHSLGSLVSSSVGKHSNEIINYNKPITPFNETQDQEYNIKTSNDPFSWFYKPKQDEKNIEISSKTFDPLYEHNTSRLDALDPNKMIGKGMRVADLKSVIKKYNAKAKTGQKIKNYGKMKKQELKKVVGQLMESYTKL